jgi:Asp-tRNA(Asn)/Glu-tRNA(Gln) amidotransferase A subunit family amidase
LNLSLMSELDLSTLTLRETFGYVALGEITAAELTAFFLKRIAAVNPQIGALTEVLESTASIEAAAADVARLQGGAPSLSGAPVVVKDIIDTVPAICSAGLSFLSDYRPKADAPVVRRLREAGAVVLGVTATDPGAFGVQTPAVCHPQDATLSVGGSSGGSGAALGAGFALASLGTDTGGSIRIPAACCAVVGFKPTRGRVPTAGVRPLVRSLDHVGPLTRSAADLPIIQSFLDPGFSETATPSHGGQLRVGRAPHWEEEADAEMQAGVADMLAACRALGAEVREVRLPDPDDLLEVHKTIFCTEAAAYHLGAFSDRLAEYPALPRQLIELGRAISGIEYVRANERRAVLTESVQSLFQEVDLLVLPTLPVLTPPRHARSIRVNGRDTDFTLGMIRYTALFDHTGHPVVAMPSKLYAPGRAASVQIVAELQRDANAVDFAIQLERELLLKPQFELQLTDLRTT